MADDYDLINNHGPEGEKQMNNADGGNQMGDLLFKLNKGNKMSNERSMGIIELEMHGAGGSERRNLQFVWGRCEKSRNTSIRRTWYIY